MPLTPMATQSSSVSFRAGVPGGAAPIALLAGEVIEVLRDGHLGRQVQVLELQVVPLAVRLVPDAEQLAGDPEVLGEAGQVEAHLVEVAGRRVAPVEEGAADGEIALVLLERAALRLVADEELHGHARRIAPLGARGLGLPGIGHTRPDCSPAYSPAAKGRNSISSLEKVSVTRLAVSATSAWESGLVPIPAARLVMQLTPATFTPMCAAAITSGTVLIPTASAPITRSM